MKNVQKALNQEIQETENQTGMTDDCLGGVNCINIYYVLK